MLRVESSRYNWSTHKPRNPDFLYVAPRRNCVCGFAVRKAA
jgi:hypothetical protein